jgi:putative transposase
MVCPHCQAVSTTEQGQRTALGERKVRCQVCKRLFNERTGTPFNFLEYPTDIVLLVVGWRLRSKLSLRDLAEMCLTRSFTFSHEAVRDWEARFAPLLAERLRAKRRGRGGDSWYADETYVKVQGCWCYLYRAIDREGNLLDAMLSETRDLEAAKQFFARALAIVGKPPQRVTTDGHSAYPRAIRETLGKQVLHRRNPYLNSRLEQAHRGIKHRYYPMRGFGKVESAAEFCQAFEEVRQWFRPRQRMKQAVSLAAKRHLFVERFAALQVRMLAAEPEEVGRWERFTISD